MLHCHVTVLQFVTLNDQCEQKLDHSNLSRDGQAPLLVVNVLSVQADIFADERLINFEPDAFVLNIFNFALYP